MPTAMAQSVRLGCWALDYEQWNREIPENESQYLEILPKPNYNHGKLNSNNSGAMGDQFAVCSATTQSIQEVNDGRN